MNRLLNDAFPQTGMFSSHQFLSQLVSALVHVLGCSGKVMVDPGLGRIAEIIGDRQHLVDGFAMVHFVLCKRTTGARSEKLGGDAHEAREQQVLTVQFGTETRHRMKQSARQLLACARGVIDVLLQIPMESLDLAGADGRPLTRIPNGEKFSGSKNALGPSRNGSA